MSSISSIYKSLSEQQKQFVDEKTISATLRIEKWLSFFAKTVKYDHKIDKQVSLMGTLTWVGAIGIFASIMVAGIAEELMIANGAVVSLMLVIFSQIKKKRLHSRDIDNNLRLFFMPVLSVLAEKAGKDTKLSASLDFRMPMQALKPIESKVRGRTLKLYEPKYIACRVLLKDGVSLEFALKDDIKDYSWTKRSASGKTKYKHKTKFTHHCFVKMTLPKSDYELRSLPPNGIILEEDEVNFFVKKKLKVKVIGEDEVLNPATFFGEIQLIYNCFLSFRLEDKPKKKEENDFEDEDEEDGNYHDNDHLLGAAIWYGSDFDRYNYDNFDHAESNEFMMDDDSVTVFDS
ncbi:MAG: hypothetical protein ACI85I_000205 [Arenicella sp.]|jgi:hypothetical protein